MADRMLVYFQDKSKYRWSSNFKRYLGHMLLLSLLVHVSAQSDQSCDNVDCVKGVRGVCKNDSTATCECEKGWTGTACDSCGGRIKLSESEGIIIDGFGNYTLDTKCSWLVEGPINATIRLRFEHFATECSWDHLYIYDGNSVFHPLIAVLSGLVIPEDRENKTMPEIMAYSGSAYLHFYSDAAYNMSGFTISYQMNACPQDCSGRGECQQGILTCKCNPGWRGSGCEIPMCPDDCGERGTCRFQHGINQCSCEAGWRGIDCSIPDTEGVWNEVVPRNGVYPSGRASHKSVIQGSKLWVASGDDFRHDNIQQLISYDLQNEVWEFHKQKNEKQTWPEQRYGHSLVHENNKLYMYGGLQGNVIVNELWMYDIGGSTWSLLQPNPGVKEMSPNLYKQYEIIGVVGHTAHLISGIMYVIFGHSPVYGYMNAVQECDIALNYTWTVPKTTGAIVKGGYGHSSVYDRDREQIYVHAGYHSTSSSGYYLSDVLYSYHPKTRKWRILSSSGQYKYLHSAVIISGLMLVFGGNTHNDTSISQGAKCYSADFLAYDMQCERWYTLDPPKVHKDIHRFGHIAELYNGEMYVFGGFNGLMLSDTYRFQPGKCDSYTNEESCLKARPGVRCVWTAERQGCLLLQDALHQKNLKVLSTWNEPTLDSCGQQDYDVNQCNKFKTCPSCVENTFECTWCGGICKQSAACMADNNKQQGAETVETCYDLYKDVSLDCGQLHNCPACQENKDCGWDSKQKCDSKVGTSPMMRGQITKCKAPCHTFVSCENCTDASCMWCSNQQRCVESNSYVASFPYGQCMEWTTQRTKCPATRCADLQTCEECERNPSCGWCDNGENMGLGACMEGGADGPVVVNGTKAITSHTKCPGHRWYFTECPLCQCNGHSTCYEQTDECIECEHLTTGPQCETCQDGFFGIATNGGNCSACECNGQADTCDTTSGKCHCRTRGVTGDHCNTCDEAHKYVGNPKNGGTCYYNLQIDFQFTFNLSKEDDKHYTQINFMNTPPAPDRDVDFNINCSGKAFLNITVKSNSLSGEQTLLSSHQCDHFKAKFSHKDHDFGKEDNTTFYVYVYDFKTPFWLQISFSQFPQIDLVHFFVTFFSCFLSLLLIAAIFWKVKQRYDLYRRRQRMFVEMEHMASRPFSVCGVEINSSNPPVATKKEPPDLRSSRRKKSNKPSPITLEPIHGHKAAILSLVVRLPTGDEDYTPPGQAGLAIGSALVTLGNPRKTSLEHNKGDKKLRKHAAAASPENCI